MKAQITGIEHNIQETLGGKQYTGHAVTYKPEPYQGREKEPVRRFIFGNQTDLISQLNAVQVGDWVDLGFVQKGKYQNLDSIMKASGPAPSPAPSSPQPYTGGGGINKSDEIARAVALKAAVDIMTARAANGGLSAANLKKPDAINIELVQHARAVLPFLKGEDNCDVVDGAPDGTPDIDQSRIGG